MAHPDPAAETGLPGGALLAGRWILVAGATGSVGGAVCAALARQGANLVVHGHDSSPAATALARRLGQLSGIRAVAVHGDVAEPGQMRYVRDRLMAQDVASLHAVINCTTGFDGRPFGLADLDVKEFRRVIDVDLVGSFVLVKELLPLLTARPGGRVVLFSSLAAAGGRPGAAHLCAAKAGVQGLALGLVRDLAPYGVRVHVVAPGPVGIHPGLSGVPYSTAEEVADVVAFLSSPLGDPISGQVLAIHGTRIAP